MNNNMVALTIANISIGQDLQGRYCLNDLHKAAGSELKHKPANWLRLDQAKALIEEIDRCSDVSNAVKVMQGGNQQGTYVVKELVYAYAMWISAKFHIQVIRAYDALVNTYQEPPTAPSQTDLFNNITIDKDHYIDLLHCKLNSLQTPRQADTPPPLKVSPYRKRRWTQGEITQLHQLYDEGASYRVIANKLNKAMSAIKYAIHVHINSKKGV